MFHKYGLKYTYIFLVFDYGCGKCDVTHPEKKCVDCDTGPLCNTEEFINKSKFCLWKTENMAKPVGMKRVCSASCIVLRDKNGKGMSVEVVAGHVRIFFYPFQIPRYPFNPINTS